MTQKKVNVLEYENQFIQTSHPSRLGKMLAHFELYKMIKELPGAIMEFGIFKGNSLLQFAGFRYLFEPQHGRKIIGFDTYSGFPPTKFGADQKYLSRFLKEAGRKGLSQAELNKIFKTKGFFNIELVKGDIIKTLPEYLKENSHLKVSLVHIDTDVYEPAKVILDNVYDRIVRGGIIVLDDYGTFPGETKAVDDFFADKKARVQKFPFSHIPSFIVKVQ